MFSGGFVGLFVEFADQLFEDVAHVVVADTTWAKVDLVELFEDEVEDFVAFEFFELFVEAKFGDNIANIWAKAL